MPDMECFPEKFEDYVDYYSIRDSDRVYSNGIVFVPAFRVKQGIEHYCNRPHAHWEQDGNMAVCSSCGEWFDMEQATVEEFGRFYRYCPNCGARMDEEAKGTAERHEGINMLPNVPCGSYHDGRCYGTREMEECWCGGNQMECQFYPEVKRKAEEMAKND